MIKWGKQKNERIFLMKKFLAEFKKFALRGNVLDMAIGIIIGGAFTGIVTSVTANFIQPILDFVLKGAPITWALISSCLSAFVSAVINFLLTALVLFLILKGVNALTSLRKKEEAPAAPTTKKCPYYKSEIAIEATRCPHCTSQIEE
jgi:large conductance mechanosensitive channel